MWHCCQQAKIHQFPLATYKTKEKGEDVNITDSTCQCSTMIAFEHHLSSNKMIPDSTPLFTFKTGIDTWSPMRQSWFLACCNMLMVWHLSKAMVFVLAGWPPTLTGCVAGFVLFKVISSNLSLCHLVSSIWVPLLVQSSTQGCLTIPSEVGAPQLDLGG